jgi:2-methylcitrate dehydratase PrpD
MLHGGVRLDAFAPERLVDPAIRAIMPRITVSLDAECEAAFPGARSAKVTIKLRDGQEFYRHQPTRKGDPDAPLSDVELDEKFLELVGPVLGASEAAGFLAQLRNSAELPGELRLR